MVGGVVDGGDDDDDDENLTTSPLSPHNLLFHASLPWLFRLVPLRGTRFNAAPARMGKRQKRGLEPWFDFIFKDPVR